MESFSDPIFIFYVSILIILGVTSLIDQYIKEKRNNEIDKYNYILLIKGIKQGTLNEESVYLIFKESNKKRGSLFFKTPYSYLKFLDSFLYYIREVDSDGTLTKSSNDIIKPIIEKIKEDDPYSNVNERERRILVSISDTINKSAQLTASEKTAVKHNLEDLALALEENQTTLEKSKKTNKWSIPLSIISTLLTLGFGILQLLQK